MMKLLQRKSRWQKLVEPVAGATPPKGVVRSGLVTVGSMAGLAVASAVVSAVRGSKDNQ